MNCSCAQPIPGGCIACQRSGFPQGVPVVPDATYLFMPTSPVPPLAPSPPFFTPPLPYSPSPEERLREAELETVKVLGLLLDRYGRNRYAIPGKKREARERAAEALIRLLIDLPPASPDGQ